VSALPAADAAHRLVGTSPTAAAAQSPAMRKAPPANPSSRLTPRSWPAAGLCPSLALLPNPPSQTRCLTNSLLNPVDVFPSSAPLLPWQYYRWEISDLLCQILSANQPSKSTQPLTP
jgi:hypothetical protein